MTVIVFQHIACEDLGTAKDILIKEGLRIKTVRLYAGELPPKDWTKAAGLIFLGGPMNVYQEKEYPYLKIEDEIIKKTIDLGKPSVGICLGAQLIAKAAGAKVCPGKRKEVGWYPLQLTRQIHKQSLLAGLSSPLTVFQWHGDTFELPDGADLLASSSLFPHQAFCLNKVIYGLQFHLEVNLEMINNWMDEYKEELEELYSPRQIEAMRQAGCKHIDLLQQRARTFFKGFAGLLKA